MGVESSDIAGMEENCASSRSLIFKPVLSSRGRQEGDQTGQSKKQAVNTFDTTQKYLIFLLSCFRAWMSDTDDAVFRINFASQNCGLPSELE